MKAPPCQRAAQTRKKKAGCTLELSKKAKLGSFVGDFFQRIFALMRGKDFALSTFERLRIPWRHSMRQDLAKLAKNVSLIKNFQ